ncbi:MAG: hypothetical protein L0H78_25110, partial [Humibacillus sp.]|nr:hypothetical protein [Humibacillus sp.]
AHTERVTPRCLNRLDRFRSGDVVYNGVHLWLAGSTPSTRSAWLAALDAVETLAPQTIVAGHRDPAAPDEDAARLLEQTRSYILDFDAAAANAGGAAEQVAVMLTPASAVRARRCLPPV